MRQRGVVSNARRGSSLAAVAITIGLRTETSRGSSDDPGLAVRYPTTR
jgi:hypothetical protein